jgi:hypothetical protein
MKKIISNAELQKTMSVAAKQFFIANSAEVIVDGILEAAAK